MSSIHLFQGLKGKIQQIKTASGKVLCISVQTIFLVVYFSSSYGLTGVWIFPATTVKWVIDLKHQQKIRFGVCFCGIKEKGFPYTAAVLFNSPTGRDVFK